MKVPVGVKVALLVLGTTLLYTYIGQLVPQKEVPAPEAVEIASDMTSEQLVEVGEKIANGKGMCLTCHTIGSSGSLRFPDLQGIATRSAERVEGMTALEYLAQSMYEPNVYIVEGFTDGMPAINKPPVGLNEQEIRAVLAWLQSLGGTPTVTLDSTIGYAAADAGAAAGSEG